MANTHKGRLTALMWFIVVMLALVAAGVIACLAPLGQMPTTTSLMTIASPGFRFSAPTLPEITTSFSVDSPEPVTTTWSEPVLVSSLLAASDESISTESDLTHSLDFWHSIDDLSVSLEPLVLAWVMLPYLPSHWDALVAPEDADKLGSMRLRNFLSTDLKKFPEQTLCLDDRSLNSLNNVTMLGPQSCRTLSRLLAAARFYRSKDTTCPSAHTIEDILRRVNNLASRSIRDATRNIMRLRSSGLPNLIFDHITNLQQLLDLVACCQFARNDEYGGLMLRKPCPPCPVVPPSMEFEQWLGIQFTLHLFKGEDDKPGIPETLKSFADWSMKGSKDLKSTANMKEFKWLAEPLQSLARLIPKCRSISSQLCEELLLSQGIVYSALSELDDLQATLTTLSLQLRWVAEATRKIRRRWLETAIPLIEIVKAPVFMPGRDAYAGYWGKTAAPLPEAEATSAEPDQESVEMVSLLTSTAHKLSEFWDQMLMYERMARGV